MAETTNRGVIGRPCGGRAGLTWPELRPVARRSILFGVGIGIPFLAAMMSGRPRGALIGTIAGLLCSLADENDRPLGARMITLGAAAAGLVTGGVIGHVLAGYGGPFCLLFGLFAFAAGWMHAYGKGLHLAFRFAAIVLALVAGFPPFPAYELMFPALALAVAAVARVIDHARFGPMPGGAAPRALRLSRRREWAWFAVFYMTAAVSGLALGVWLGEVRALWIMTVPLVVMQPDPATSYRRAIEFAIGTGLGVMAAWVVSREIRSVALLCGLVVVLAAAIPHHFPHRFWLQTGLIALMLLIVYGLAAQDAAALDDLMFERLKDILLGSLIAIVATAAAFSDLSPVRGARTWRS